MKFGNAPWPYSMSPRARKPDQPLAPRALAKPRSLNAAAGMKIDFTIVTTSHFIADETAAVASATSLTMAENAAVKAFAGAGVAYFNFQGNEYFIATDNFETAVSSHDAIVELVGVTDIHRH